MLSPNDTPGRHHPSLDYRPPSYLRAIKIGLIAFVGIAALAVIWVVAWFTLASNMRASTEAWIDQRRAEDFTVQYSKLELSGFPFMLRATIDGPGLGRPDVNAPWVWQGERLVMQARPWMPWRLRLIFEGTQTVRLTGGDGPLTYMGTAGELALDLDLDDGSPESGRLSIAALSLSTESEATAFAVERGELQAWRRDADAADYRASTLDVVLSARKLKLPRGFLLPLGEMITALELEGSVRGTIPAGPWPDSLVQWRDAGGTVEVARLGLTYGPLSVRANGTMALDEDVQPIGAFTAKVQGFFPLVDALHKKGLVRARDALTAKVVLGVLARKPDGGGPSTLNLPLTLQGRKIYAGPVPLTEVPAVPW